nr:nucleotide-binding, alpha-beta plait [Tanacetum cinerariifolium]
LARTIGASSSSSSPSSAVLRRGSERRRTPTTMYVPRDNGIGKNRKEKSTYVQIYKRDDQLSSSSVKLSGSGVPKQNQQRKASGRIIRSILVKKNAHQSRPEQQNQAPNRDMDRRPPRYSNVPPLLKDSNGLPDDKVSGHDVHGFYSEKQDK